MKELTDQEFTLFSTYIKKMSGINLKPEKKTLIVGRLNSRVFELKLEKFIDYYDYLLNDTTGKEVSILIDKITTNHTFFMREAEHFDYFFNTALPYIYENNKSRDLRVWCAASSSGEEPYTLAILLEEFYKTKNEKYNKKILATDLSTTILTKAIKGEYPKDDVEKLPKTWILNYFIKKAMTYEVKDKIKEEVIYRRFNLLEPKFPFKKKFHIIFCRNVMIYFDNKTKDELIGKFYDHLEYGGFLFIGHSETVNRNKSKFKYIKPAIYRKI